MLTARTDQDPYVEAALARRGLAYACRLCGAPVTFKPGRTRAAHFAHRPDAACAFGAAMSPAHLAAQGRIAVALRARGLAVELEASLSGPGHERRIDVLAWPPARPATRIAIEVQASNLTAEAIETRTASYDAIGAAPLWLRLLDFGGFPAIQTLPLRATVWIERYRARAWERWAHDALGGRLWFMDAGTGLVWRGLFVGAHRGRERGLMRGADWTAASQWVDLELDGPYALETLRLRRARTPGTQRLFAAFVPPGETHDDPISAPAVRVVFQQETRGQSRHLEVRLDGVWTPAVTEGARSDWRTRRAEPRPALAPIAPH